MFNNSPALWEGVLNTPVVDPYYSQVVLLLKDTWTDLSLVGQTPTHVGTSATSGAGVLNLASTNGYAQYDYTFAATSEDFTIEYFVECTGYSNDLAPVWDRYALSGLYDSGFTALMGDAGIANTSGSTGSASMTVYNGGYNTANSAVLNMATCRSRHHVAYIRKGTVVSVSINGILFTNVAGAATAAIARMRIGNLNSGQWHTAKIDNVRCTKGVARWDPTGIGGGVQFFTPPSIPFPNY
jgi:hypothetical protein